MQSSLIIDLVDATGKKLQKTITFVNPAATNDQLEEFSQRLVALTTSTLTGASRVDKSSVTESYSNTQGAHTLIITYTDSAGQTKQKTIPNINPEVSNSTLQDFAQRLIALTTNSFAGATRISKINIAEYTPPDPGEQGSEEGSEQGSEPTPIVKQTPTLSISEFTKDGTTYTATITYNGDGQLTTNLGSIDDVTLIVENEADFFEGTLSASETDNFTAASINFGIGVVIDNAGSDKTQYTLLAGTPYSDTISNDRPGVTIQSGAGNDSIYTWFNRQQIDAGEGDDTVYIGSVGGRVTAGGGNDSVKIYGTVSTAYGNEGNDTLISASSQQTLYGNEGNDYINLGYGDTVLGDGGEGNDTITFKGGSRKTVIGGTGDDLIDFHSDMNLILYNAGDGNDTIYGFRPNTTLSIVGADYSTQISGADVLVFVGNDTINLYAASLTTDSVHINNEVITLDSEPVNVTISNDFTYHTSGKSKSTISTGTGDDVVVLTSNYISINTGAGNDSIRGISIGHGESRYPSVFAGDGDDTVISDNTMTQPLIDGGAGNDYLENVAQTYATIYGGEGNDTINNRGTNYSSGNSYPHYAYIDGGAGDDSIYSKSLQSTIYGGSGKDTIFNDDAREVSISGGSGNDIIYQVGRLGSVSGGTGNDLISLGANATQTANSIFYNYGDGNDTILNFKTSDTLYVTGSTFTTTKSGNDVIVNVGSEYITIEGGATVSPLNIVSA